MNQVGLPATICFSEEIQWLEILNSLPVFWQCNDKTSKEPVSIHILIDYS